MAAGCVHTHRRSQHSTELIRRFPWWLVWLPKWIKHWVVAPHLLLTRSTGHGVGSIYKWRLKDLSVSFLSTLYTLNQMWSTCQEPLRECCYNLIQTRDPLVLLFGSSRPESQASDNHVFNSCHACSISGPWRVIKVQGVHDLIARAIFFTF